MKVGQLVEARTPRGTVKRGRFVAKHETHNGVWLEIREVNEKDKVGVGSATFRSRPGSETEVTK